MKAEGLGTNRFAGIGKFDIDQTPHAARFLFCGTNLQQQRVALEAFHATDFMQTRPELFEFSPTHRTLFVAAPAASGEHIQVFPVTGQFDFDLLLDLFPWLGKKLTFKSAEASGW